jgi:hypothetical protein
MNAYSPPRFAQLSERETETGYRARDVLAPTPSIIGCRVHCQTAKDATGPRRRVYAGGDTTDVDHPSGSTRSVRDNVPIGSLFPPSRTHGRLRLAFDEVGDPLLYPCSNASARSPSSDGKRRDVSQSEISEIERFIWVCSADSSPCCVCSGSDVGFIDLLPKPRQLGICPSATLMDKWSLVSGQPHATPQQPSGARAR